MTMPRPRIPALARTTRGAIGLILLTFVLGVAIFGPLFAPHGYAASIGSPGAPPYSGAPLGTDYLGRDVLSRLLDGGWSVIWIGGAATLAAYVAGLTIGLVAGYSRTVVDPILMRVVDVLLSFPALLLMLLFVGGLGSHISVLILGVTLVQLPGIARVMRTATLETSTRGYVEAAVSRGESSSWVLRREILPNIAPVLLADFGVRFSYSIILIASMNYLGLGLQPPAPDWGVMMSENRSFVTLNMWSVLAPAIMLGFLTIGVNLVADAYVRTTNRSQVRAMRRRTVWARLQRTPAID
jgi:peptide/nickel transport system permease protein